MCNFSYSLIPYLINTDTERLVCTAPLIIRCHLSFSCVKLSFGSIHSMIYHNEFTCIKMSKGTLHFQPWLWSWFICEMHTCWFFFLFTYALTSNFRHKTEYPNDLFIRIAIWYFMNVYLWFFNQMLMIPSLESYRIMTCHQLTSSM